MSSEKFVAYFKDKYPQLSVKTTIKEVIDKYPAVAKTIFENFNTITYIGNDLSVFSLKLIPGGFIIKSGSSTEYSFNKEGKLESIDENGSPTVRVLYDFTGKMVGIAGGAHYIELSYSVKNLIRQIVFDDHTKYNYSYYSNNLLKSITVNNFDKHKHTFVYNDKLLLSEIRNSKSSEKIKISYDKENHRTRIESKNSFTSWLFSQQDSLIMLTKVSYKRENKHSSYLLHDSLLYSFNKSSGWVGRKDILENEEEYFLLTPCTCGSLIYVKRNNVTGQGDIRVHDSLLDYVNSHMQGITDPKVKDSIFSANIDQVIANSYVPLYDSVFSKYDDFGNILEVRKNGELTTWHYHPEYMKTDTIKKIKEGQNNLKVFSYDQRGNLIYVRDTAYRQSIRITYNSRNQMDTLLVYSDSTGIPVLENKLYIFYTAGNQMDEIGLVENGKVITSAEDRTAAGRIIGPLQRVSHIIDKSGLTDTSHSYKNISNYDEEYDWDTW